MNYKVVVSDHFKKEAKRLTKKFPSLKSELTELVYELEKNPIKGSPLGNNVFKVRLGIASKGRGKSGGARIITFVQVMEHTVLLLSIYNKSEKDTISDKEIQDLLSRYGT